MLTPPLPPVPEGNETRLARLNELNVLDTEADDRFDEITRFVALVCDTPTALVSLVDRERQWFKSRVGFDDTQTDLACSVCAYVVFENGFIEIPDLTADDRTANNPLVTVPDGARFYAGAPLRLSTGDVVGALCVLDEKPRVLTGLQRETLRVMARQVVAQLELQQSVDHAEMLTREVDHRVKNSLQSISSLTRIQARKSGSEEVKTALSQVQRRVEMVAALHEQLYKTGVGHEVDLAKFICRASEILGATAPEGVQVKADCAPFMIDAKRASAVGVILNEFAANSFKHAFPEGTTGDITFTATIENGESYCLEMSDTGVGMGAVTHTSGIGLMVIEASVAQLGGTWEPLVPETGTAARLRFPLRNDG